jgi:hypothetical protein
MWRATEVRFPSRPPQPLCPFWLWGLPRGIVCANRTKLGAWRDMIVVAVQSLCASDHRTLDVYQTSPCLRPKMYWFRISVRFTITSSLPTWSAINNCSSWYAVFEWSTNLLKLEVPRRKHDIVSITKTNRLTIFKGIVTASYVSHAELMSCGQLT